MSRTFTEDEQTIDRRKLLQSLGVVTAAGFAGCGGDSSEDPETTADDGGGGGGGGDSDLGERVPSLVHSYWSDMGAEYTAIHETINDTIGEAYDALGLEVEFQGQGITSQSNAIFNNTADFHAIYFGQSWGADKLEPQEWLADFEADSAHGGGNWANYVDCEYTEYSKQQASATSPEERQDLISQARGVINEDAVQINLTSKVQYSAHHERIDLQGVGQFGFTNFNMKPFILSDVTEGAEEISINFEPAYLENINPKGVNITLQTKLLNSQLLDYDVESLELKGLLAEDWEISDDGTVYTITLRDDVTFHNGDPVTAEDCAWTFDHLTSHPETYTSLVEIPLVDENPFEVIDERTFTISLTEPFPPLTNNLLYDQGILHKESFVEMGAEDNPGLRVDQDAFVGSGPFQLETLQQGELMALTPFEDHPTPPSHDLVLNAFTDPTSAFQAFREEELDMLIQTNVNIFQQLEDVEHAVQVPSPTLGMHMIHGLEHHPPFQFTPMKKALGAAINRADVNSLAYRGEADVLLDSEIMLEGHPFRPPDDQIYTFTDDPTGDVEQARQILEDAGWGWDDDGRLHYPPDADLSPKLPADGVADVPCIDSNGEYIPPDER